MFYCHPVRLRKCIWLQCVPVAFFLLFVMFPLAGQTILSGFDVRILTIKDGMTNSYVCTIERDRSGLLWVSTNEGLDIFDGQRFSAFGPIPSVNGKFLHKSIRSLQLDDNGLLFVSTKDGARIIDPLRRTLVDGAAIGIPDSLFMGNIVIKKSLSGDLFWAKNTTIYQLHPSETGRYSIRKRGIIPNCPNVTLLPDQDDPNRVWVVTSSCGIFSIGSDGARHVPILGHPKGKRLQFGHLSFFVLNNNRLWNNLQHSYQYEPAVRQLVRRADPLPIAEFPGFEILDSLYRNDRLQLTSYTALEGGQIAYGTNKGLFILRKNPALFKPFPELRGNEVRGIYLEPDGRRWISTYQGLYTNRKGTPDFDVDYSLCCIWQFEPLNDSLLLAAAEFKKGVFKLNKRNFKMRLIKLNPLIPDTLDGYLAICRDFRNVYWIGTYLQLVRSTSTEPDSFSCYTDPVTGARFLRSMVRALFADPDSSIWVGAEDGLYHLVFDPEVNDFRLETTQNYLPGISVSHMHLDTYGHLWVATKNKGLVRINKRTGRIDWFNNLHGLSNNATSRIESSHNGRILWISTHNGLSRLDLLTGVFENYFEEHGLSCNEFNSAASTACPDGKLLFGGVAGLTEVDPYAIESQNFKLQTLLPLIRVYDAQKNAVLGIPSTGQSMELPPYPEYLEIPLASSEFIQASRILFRYRLIGLFDQWRITRGQQDLKFFRLPPGYYTLEVQAISPNGLVSNIQTLKLFVQKPYYETWWFYLCCLFGVSLLIYAAHAYRVYQLKKEQRIRRQLADDLHDNIGNKLNIISILAQKIADKPGNSLADGKNTALHKLVAASRDTLSALHIMIWAVDAKKNRLSDLVTRMQDFADDYLIPLQIQFAFTLPNELPSANLKLKIRHHLILLYQETLTNMVKHSNPEKIVVQIRLVDNVHLRLSITANLNPQAGTETRTTFSSHRGEESIKHRLQQINGRLVLRDSNPTQQKFVFYISNIFE